MARRKSTRKSRKKRTPSSASQILRYGAEASVFVFTGLILLAISVAFFARDLPRTDNLWRADREARITFLAADGTPLPLQGASAGAPISLSDLPGYVPDAILAVEDRNFYHHMGVNPISVVRALIVNASHGAVRQGGSTISQQLAKNLFLSPERTMKRKVQELMLALWLEQRFTKDEILTLYVNRVYFGAGAYGIDAASYRYFAKSARALTLNEAAVLAGLLKAPSKYSPSHNPKSAGTRARLVIEAMVAAGFLSSDDANHALVQPVVLAGQARFKAPFFLDFTVRETNKITNGLDADLVVQTTLVPAMQTALTQGVRAGLERSALDPSIEIAALILDETGAVRAMTGGRDYAISQFNRATQARRQPGSAFKPFVFLAALEHGAPKNLQITDAPVKIGTWSPDNYNSKFYGDVGLTEALARSLNSVAVRVQEHVGRNAVQITAHKMGLDAKLSNGPALALGVDALSPLVLAGAYTPFANGGYRIRPHGVSAIKTVDGQQVFRLETPFEDIASPVHAIDGLNDMMGAVVSWGTGRAAALDAHQAYGKTGTTQNNRDAWFVGHAGGLTAVVWVGRDDNKPMGQVTGGKAPAIIWREIMNRALSGKPATRAIQSAATITPINPADDPVAAILSGDSTP